MVGHHCLLGLTWLVLSGLGDMAEGSGQCRRPSGEGMIPAEREFYHVGESVAVRCQTGYRPSRERIQCLNPQTSNEWDINVQCIGQCQRTYVVGMIPVDREFYNVGESVTVRCQAGYRPLHDRITCTSRQPNDVWDNPAMCIAQCGKPPIEGLISAYKEYYEVGESLPVQCRTGYRPAHDRIYCRNPRTDSEWDPVSRCSGDNIQASDLHELVIDSITENGVITWRLLNHQGNVTGFQLDITVRRDHDPSFTRKQSLRFPPNVTQYQILLQPGSHYTVTIRAVTSSGDGRQAVYVIETPPGGGRNNSSKDSEHFIFRLDLVSALWIFVPIFTVKLLALVVLLRIQHKLMDKGSKGKWICDWKRREDELYDDVEEAEPS